MSDSLSLIATAAFGLEAVVGRELKQLGYPPLRTEDGRVHFSADVAGLARANLWLRSADRVLVNVGDFPARDFGELFDRVNVLPWEQWLGIDAAFPVRGKSVKSTLHSVPDVQRIVKKAIVERLKKIYGCDWLEETGPQYSVEASLLRDQATLTIDTSGTGLHKRGYRTNVGQAPLKETLAAALVQLSYWNRERVLIDPCCGGGTIPIEAALIGLNMAPGMHRSFAAEQWPQIDPIVWKTAREQASSSRTGSLDFRLIGTDISLRELSFAREHAANAGVAEHVHFQRTALAELKTPHKYGCLITNPPYGQRLGESEDVELLYRQLGEFCEPLDTWSVYVLTASSQFEKCFGQRADRRRKLYNARIPCTYYQYQGPRPPQRDRS